MTTLDVRGLTHMMPVVKLASAIKKSSTGDEITVISDYHSFGLEVERWCKSTGNKLKQINLEGTTFEAVVIKG